MRFRNLQSVSCCPKFLITTLFTVSSKLEIVSNFEHIISNKPVKEEITHFIQFTQNCFVEKVLD